MEVAPGAPTKQPHLPSICRRFYLHSIFLHFYTLKKKKENCTLNSHLSSICNSLPWGHHKFLLYYYDIREPNTFTPLAFRTRHSQMFSKVGSEDHEQKGRAGSYWELSTLLIKPIGKIATRAPEAQWLRAPLLTGRKDHG